MRAVARIAKLKGNGIAMSELHTSRARDTPNANPDRLNQRLIGMPSIDGQMTLDTLVQQRIGEQRIRKDAVLCVEMLLSASAEYFRPMQPEQAGVWDEVRLLQFQFAVQQWLTANYGDRIVRAELHLDEATPHIHAYLVPIDERGRLNCKGLFGDREKLRQWQDSYAKALEPLGIQRGVRGSRATHTAIQDYYAAVMEEPSIGLDTATIQHQVADRRLLVKERDELKATVQVLEQRVAQQAQMIRALQVRDEEGAERGRSMAPAQQEHRKRQTGLEM
jgi:hypothetical protein